MLHSACILLQPDAPIPSHHSISHSIAIHEGAATGVAPGAKQTTIPTTTTKAEAAGVKVLGMLTCHLTKGSEQGE